MAAFPACKDACSAFAHRRSCCHPKAADWTNSRISKRHSPWDDRPCLRAACPGLRSQMASNVLKAEQLSKATDARAELAQRVFVHGRRPPADISLYNLRIEKRSFMTCACAEARCSLRLKHRNDLQLEGLVDRRAFSTASVSSDISVVTLDAEESFESEITDALPQIELSRNAALTRNSGAHLTVATLGTLSQQCMQKVLSWRWNRKDSPGESRVPGRAVLLKFAVMATLMGLEPISSAWARAEAQPILSFFDLGGLSDIQSGFASAFLLIFFSEIGDKTFFIAAILAARRSSVAVFSGTFGALAIMTVISVFLGRIFHYIDGILPSIGDQKFPVDDIAAVVLLVYFGVSTLLEASSMSDSDSGEEQQEAELAIAGVSMGGAGAGTVVATFALVFVAEWGDKSFFSTIALAAASSPLGVVTGAIAGHGAATLLAVLGGSFLGSYISEKVIAYIGGGLFLSFACITLYEILK